MAAAGFLSHYLSGPLPYVRRHITVKENALSASLNKTFLSFLPSFLPSNRTLFFKIRSGIGFTTRERDIDTMLSNTLVAVTACVVLHVCSVIVDSQEQLTSTPRNSGM